MKDFVTSKANPVNYTVKDDNNRDVEDKEMKKINLELVSYQIKFQTHNFQKLKFLRKHC